MNIKTVWELDLIGDITFRQVEEQTNKFVDKWKDRADYLDDPLILKEALDDFNKWQKSYSGGGDEAYRIALKTALDQNNSELKAKYNKLHDKVVQLYNRIQFFLLNVARIPKEKQKEFLDTPELSKYNHFLKLQFEFAKYLLTEKEERILNLKSKTAFANWVEMTENLLSKETRGGKSFSEILSLLSDKEKKVRDQAAEWFNDILQSHIDPGEHELNSILEDAKINHNLRGYKRPDKPRHLSDDVNTELIDTLLETVSSHYEISQKYYELKAKLLDLKELEYHERNVSYGKAERSFKFEEAVEIIDSTFKNLDPEFSKIFNRFLLEGHLDVYPKKNKVSGAGCWSGLKTQPTFIHLNFTEKLRDVITIAHEMGHAIHHELVAKKQPAIYVDTSLATAETASIFMEDFVIQTILKDADDELRLALQMEQLNDSISSIQRQVACYKFEQDLHRIFRNKGYLSKEEIGDLFQKHMEAYMGEFVEQSEGSENWWLYWSHIRRHFYVYSYASGHLISKSLQNKVKENSLPVGKVKEVLAMGTSKSPKKAFEQIGVDITDTDFWEKGLQEQNELLKQTWTLAKKLGKI